MDEIKIDNDPTHYYFDLNETFGTDLEKKLCNSRFNKIEILKSGRLCLLIKNSFINTLMVGKYCQLEDLYIRDCIINKLTIHKQFEFLEIINGVVDTVELEEPVLDLNTNNLPENIDGIELVTNFGLIYGQQGNH